MIAAAGGASLGEDAVKLTVYLTDMAAFAEVNEVYGGFFEGDPPARVAYGVAALPKGAQVEIDAILALPGLRCPFRGVPFVVEMKPTITA